MTGSEIAILVVGIFIGVNFGILLAGLLAAAARGSGKR